MNELVYVEGMKPGHGIDVLAGNLLQNIAVIGPLTPITIAQGQRITSQMVRIDDVTSLHKSLGINVSASGYYYGYSASAKMEFATECNINSHSTYLLVRIQVQNAFLSMDDPVLSPDALDLLTAHRADRFRERFGDVFIAGLNTGGEYFAIIEISGTNEKEKESLSIQVNAAYQGIVAAVELGTSIKKATESSHDHLEVKVFTYQVGGQDTQLDVTPEQIMAKAHNFAASVSGQFSVPYSVLPASYISLKKPDDADNPIDIEFQKVTLADAFKQRTDMMSLNNDIEYILQSTARNFDEFEQFDVAALTQARNDLAAQLDLNFKTASKCMRDAKQCTFAVFDISGIKLPKRKVGALPAKTMPLFVGLTWTGAYNMAIAQGLIIEEFQATGSDDPDAIHEGTSVQYLMLGDAFPEEGAPALAHTGDQIVCLWQKQPAGTMLDSGMSAVLAFDLAAGVPR